MATRLSAALDRLSSEIDPGKYEERRFAREEGVTLKHAVTIASDALRESGFNAINFDLLNMPGIGIVVSHNDPNELVGNLHMKVSHDQLDVWFEPKGNFTIHNLGRPSTAPIEGINDAQILEAVGEQIDRIQFAGYST